MKNKRKNYHAYAVLAGIGVSFCLPALMEPAHASTTIAKQDKKVNEKEAERLLYQAPEATPLTVEGEKTLNEHYVEKYMPVEGCSLVEELPKTSDIHYTPPKPKPKPKPKPVKVKPANVKSVQTGTLLKEKDTTKQVKPKVEANPAPVTSTPSATALSMTAEERLWLERLVEAESGGEPYEGRLAVATIIANRVEMPEFPGTVMEVITAPKQFSPFIDGSVHNKVPSPETKRAVAEVFDKGIRTLPADAAYFCTTEIAPRSWIGQTRPFITAIGNHSFYLK
nr:cell wall hydrolase [Jeotgalibacillus malaysiensis]